MKLDTVRHVPDQDMTSRRRQTEQRGLLPALSLKPPANVLLDRSALYCSGGNISAFCLLQARLDSNICSTDDWEDLQSSSFTSQLENIHKKLPISWSYRGLCFITYRKWYLHIVFMPLAFCLHESDQTFQGLCFKTCRNNRGYFCRQNPADPTYKLSYVEELLQQAPPPRPGSC